MIDGYQTNKNRHNRIDQKIKYTVKELKKQANGKEKNRSYVLYAHVSMIKWWMNEYNHLKHPFLVFLPKITFIQITIINRKALIY